MEIVVGSSPRSAHRKSPARRLVCERRAWRYRDAFMATRRHKAPEQIGAAMQPILDRLDREGHFAIVRLAKAWPEVVGETIARRTEVVSLKFHTAVIKVSRAIWIQELNLLRRRILEKLVERMGDDSVRDLRFVTGRLSRRSTSRPRLV